MYMLRACKLVGCQEQLLVELQRQWGRHLQAPPRIKLGAVALALQADRRCQAGEPVHDMVKAGAQHAVVRGQGLP